MPEPGAAYSARPPLRRRCGGIRRQQQSEDAKQRPSHPEDIPESLSRLSCKIRACHPPVPARRIRVVEGVGFEPT